MSNQYYRWQPEDTARVTAAFRAVELEQNEALFRDEWAPVMAGNHGRKLLEKFPGYETSANGSVVRTHLIDQLLLDSFSEQNIDTVLCLGAGYDTRPYRLCVPDHLNWIEVDLPGVLQRKRSLLQQATPFCNVQRIIADFQQHETRQSWKSQLMANSNRTAVVTEGLLVYLTPAEVESLAADLFETGVVVKWITDLAAPLIREWMNLQAVNNPQLKSIKWAFAPENPAGDFSKLHWQLSHSYSCIEHAEMLNRPIILPDVKAAMHARGVDVNQLSTVAVLEPLAV
tara:strand:- start:40673 stop:41527 length:855 start_codon:yes stop_codon:yes gene_type:complete